MLKVNELAKTLNLEMLSEANGDKEISGVYIGDLLSNVMINCDAGNVWLTAQTHVNIINVADLNEAACIVIVGATQVDDSLIEKASERDVALLTTNMESYELAWKIHEVL